MAAFHFSYDWSHATGIAERARQTEDFTGERSGSGLYWNYSFTVPWVADAVYWWRGGPERYRRRSPALNGTIHAFFFFMIFKGAVVFASGVSRLLGVTVSLAKGGAILRWYYLHNLRVPAESERN